MAQIIRSSTELSERIRAIENRTRHSANHSSSDQLTTVRTGWRDIDQLTNGLPRQCVHEWITTPPPEVAPAPEASPKFSPKAALDLPPSLTLLTHLAWAALGPSSSATHPSSNMKLDHADFSPEDSNPSTATGTVFWIGRRCWPSARTLLRSASRSTAAENSLLLQRSIFLDPPDLNTQLWAMDLCLRSPATCAVIADGTGLDMAATRRLQLAAAAGNALTLLTRSSRELKSLSAAMTRWRVQPVVAPPWFDHEQGCVDEPEPAELARPLPGAGQKSFLSSMLTHCRKNGLFPAFSRQLRMRFGPRPRWMLELLRCKGLQPDPNARATRWVLEWDCETGLVVVPAKLGDRSVASPRESSILERNAKLALAAPLAPQRSIA